MTSNLLIFFNIFISDELLERNAQWTNEWFQVKKAREPNKHRAPKMYQICCSGLGHQHTKGADGSRYQSIYEPTEPSQPMMSDSVNDEAGPQHWEVAQVQNSKVEYFVRIHRTSSVTT